MSTFYIVAAAVIVGVVVIMAWTRTGDAGQNTDRILSAEAFLAAVHTHSDAVIIDVRTPAEYQSGHMKDARNIDLQSASFITDITALDPARTYFVYCRSGRRSAAAIRTMQEKGIHNVFELRDGIASAPQLVTQE